MDSASQPGVWPFLEGPRCQAQEKARLCAGLSPPPASLTGRPHCKQRGKPEVRNPGMGPEPGGGGQQLGVEGETEDIQRQHGATPEGADTTVCAFTRHLRAFLELKMLGRQKTENRLTTLVPKGPLSLLQARVGRREPGKDVEGTVPGRG